MEGDHSGRSELRERSSIRPATATTSTSTTITTTTTTTTRSSPAPILPTYDYDHYYTYMLSFIHTYGSLPNGPAIGAMKRGATWRQHGPRDWVGRR